MRHHNVPVEDAKRISVELNLQDPNTRCSICGIPTYLLEVYISKGPWPRWMGVRSKSLQIDHLVPGDWRGGLRPLCGGCNARRGDAIYTDQAVLMWIRRRWSEVSNLRMLWWLNETPGQGGRLHMSPTKEKREERFTALREASEGMNEREQG